MTTPFHRPRVLLGIFLLVLLVAIPYAQIRHNEFVHFDDYGYIVDNPNVNAGISGAGLRWAFTTHHMANWHPLTWVSHMLDCQWFGVNPGAHHLVGATLHLLNALLLFLALWVMTRATGPSLLVAALFAVHPLRVESVAWASERKDLLAGLFWMLGMLAWTAYARRPGIARYFAVCACLAVGLLAKPMLVTLPVVLLLLDFWPLGRLTAFAVDDGGTRRYPVVTPRRAVAEKIPLLALAALSGVATLAAQSAGGAMEKLDALPIAARVGNAVVAYVAYLWKTVWPVGLTFYYPHPAIVAPGDVGALVVRAIASGVVLVALTALAVRFAHKRPQLLVGWLWYVVTLLPVIGFIQVGNQAMADRYTYIPLVGIYLAAAWSLQEVARRRPALRLVLAASVVVVVGLLAMATSLQTRTWKNSTTLFVHALQVTEDNYVAHVNLGNVVARAGDLDAAEAHYLEALQINPNQADAHHNLGGALLQRGDAAGSIPHYRVALRLRPDYVSAHLNLGLALDAAGMPRKALVHYERAERLEPGSHRAQVLLAGALARLGEDAGAEVHYRRALEHRPDSLEAAKSLAWLLATSPDPAVRNGDEALVLAKRCADASGHRDPFVLASLAAAHAERGRFEAALRWQSRALALAPEEFRPLFRDRLRSFRNGLPLRETPADRAAASGTP